MPRDSVGQGNGQPSWKNELKQADYAGDYLKARKILTAQGYRVPKINNGTGWLYKYAMSAASRGMSRSTYETGALNLAQRKGNKSHGEIYNFFNGAVADRAAEKIRNQKKVKDGAEAYRKYLKDKKKGNGTGTRGATGDGPGAGSPGALDAGLGVPSQTQWGDYMPQGLLDPKTLAASMTAMEFGAAERAYGKLIRNEKRREAAVPKWVDASYDPLISGLEGDRTQQQNFGNALQQNFGRISGGVADLFGDNQGAAATQADVAAQGSLGQLADLTALQSAQNTDAVGAARRSKTFRTDELTDRTRDRLTELRDKLLNVQSDRRSAYNRYLTEAQFNKQKAIGSAVDIAGALQNQNLAQAMAGYQLQQAALDTTALSDQIGYNRKNQAWTDLMNQAGLQKLREEAAAGKRGAFVPWNKVGEGDRITLIESIISPWVQTNPDTGQPTLTTSRQKAKQVILNRLAAAGYATKKNKAIGSWVDAYITGLPATGYMPTGEVDGPWADVGNNINGL